MITIEGIKENLLKLERVHMDDFNNEICMAFEDFEYEGEDCVIVTSDSSKWEEYPNTYLAYVNHVDSPIFSIDVEYSDMCICVDEVRVIGA